MTKEIINNSNNTASNVAESLSNNDNEKKLTKESVLTKKTIKPLSYKKNIKEWHSIIKEARKDKGVDILFIIDTETTGGLRKGDNKGVSVMELDDPKMRGKMHRVIEFGGVFCKRDKATGLIEPMTDSSNNTIFIHEYLNPFSEKVDEHGGVANTIPEIQNGAYMVHGISKGFLSGVDALDEGEGVSVKIDGGAAYFKDILPDIMRLIETDDDVSPVYGACHNFPFDAAFLDFEFENCIIDGEQSPRFQSTFLPFDTIPYFRDLISEKEIVKLKEEHGVKKGKYSLDTLTQLMQKGGYMKETFDRDLHGAYKDVLITIAVYNSLTRYSMQKEKVIDNLTKINVNSFSKRISQKEEYGIT